MRDWRGNLIDVGSYIVYPQRQGSSMWMVEARVDEITEREDSMSRVVPILKVSPVGATWTHTVGVKKTTLTKLDRVTVVAPPPKQTVVDYCTMCHDFHGAVNGTCTKEG